MSHLLGVLLVLLLSPCSSQSYTYTYKQGVFSSSTAPKVLQTYTTLSDGDQFGSAVAIWNSRAVVSSTTLLALQDGSVSSGGKVYLFNQNHITREWVDSKRTFQSAYGGDGYGTSVAIWSSTIAVGAPNINKVYIYTGTSYSTESEIEAHEAGEDSYFGHSVAIVHGGGIYGSGAVVVGAYGHNANPEHENSGSVFVFLFNSEHGDGEWEQVSFLQPSHAHQNGYFGYSVSAFGNTLAVGAPGAGTVYLFALSAKTVQCPHEGHMPSGCEHEHEHHHLRRVLQEGHEGHEGEHEGEHEHEHDEKDKEHEIKYYRSVFYREELEVTGVEGENLGFGSSVSVYNSTVLSVAIGSIYDYESSASAGTGAVYIISQMSSSDVWGSWKPSEYYSHAEPNEHDEHDEHGEHNEHDHRRRFLQGGHPEDHDASHRYWPIKLTGYTADKLNNFWMLEKVLYGSNPGEQFGYSVAIEYSHVIVGNHPSSGDGIGKAGFYGRVDGTESDGPVHSGPLYKKTWASEATLTDVYGASGDRFGAAVGLFGGVAIVGSYFAGYSSSSGLIGTGAAYIYDTVKVIATEVVETTEPTQAVVDTGLTGIMKSMTILSFAFIVAVFASFCAFVAYSVTVKKVNDGSLDGFYEAIGRPRKTTKSSSLMDSSMNSMNSQHAMLDNSSSSTSSSVHSSQHMPSSRPMTRAPPVSGGGNFSKPLGQMARGPSPSNHPPQSRPLSMQQLGAAAGGSASRGVNRPPPGPSSTHPRGPPGPSSTHPRGPPGPSSTHSRGPPPNRAASSYSSRMGNSGL